MQYVGPRRQGEFGSGCMQGSLRKVTSSFLGLPEIRLPAGWVAFCYSMTGILLSLLV